MKNAGQFSVRVKALDPVGDDSPENQAKMAAARDARDQTLSDRNDAVQEKWEAKLDACNDNEACENRVRGQMMADPEFQRIVRKLQGAGPRLVGAMSGVNVAPRYQLWVSDPPDPSPASGKLQVDLQETNYGVIDTGGGGKVNYTCRWSGGLEIAQGSSDSKVGATLRVDAKTSIFEIRIPAEQFGARLPESCSDSKTGSHGKSKNTREVPLIGRAPARGVKDFTQALTFKGPIASVRSPQVRGKESIVADLGDPNNPQASQPVKVTIEWQFTAGGR